MKIAIPVWRDQVSVAFDFARSVLLIQLEDGVEAGRSEIILADDPPLVRVGKLARHGTDLLICGAISIQLSELLASREIKVISDICGNTEEVLNAYIVGRLDDPGFLLPGRLKCRKKKSREGCRYR